MPWQSSISLNDQHALLGLGVALAVGLLFGLERGWHRIQQEETGRAAGVRTYGLIGLLGGVAGLLAVHLDPTAFGWMFGAVALVLAIAYAISAWDSGDTGVTSLVGALLTFGLGALATVEMIPTAVAAAVVATLLLGFKPELHAWVGRLDRDELQATLKLLLLSLVVLPLLPNQGLGPGGAVNPYELWWLVVLIAAISYLGYFAVKVTGPNKGIMITSFLAGLASSTALTLQLSRLARDQDADTNLLGAGILVANATLIPRVLIIVVLVAPDLIGRLLIPLLVMTLLISVPALALWLRRRSSVEQTGVQVENPLALGLALRFGVLLVVVTVLAQLLADAFGDAGVLALAGLSGVADVNAITLSIGRLHEGTLAAKTAVSAILLAILSNALLKSALCGITGRRGLSLRVGIPLILATALPLVMAWLWDPQVWAAEIQGWLAPAAKT